MTSTWRAPAWTAASVFAVARPRSLWQWTLTVASRPTRSTTVPTSRAELGRDRVADGVRDVDASRRPPRRRPRRPRAGTIPRSATRPRPRTRSPRPRPSVSRAQRDPLARRRASACSRVSLSLCLRWMSLVAMNRWRCGRSATPIASTARCGSPSRQRASAATAIPPLVSCAIRRTASKSPGEAAGKPASITSTRSRASWRATSSFSAAVRPAPGACSPSRSVVSKIRTDPAATPPPNRGWVASNVIARPPPRVPRPAPRSPRPAPGRPRRRPG